MTAQTEALQREVEDLLQFVYLMPVAVLRLDALGRVAMINPKAVQLLQDLDIDSSHADGVRVMDALCPSTAAAWRAHAGRTGPMMAPQRCSLQAPQRGAVHLLVRLVGVDAQCAMLTLEDISAVVEQEREVARQRRRLALALEQIRGYGVLMLDCNGAVSEWNPSLGHLFGITEGALQGQGLLDWVDHTRDLAGAAAPPADFNAIRQALGRQGWCQLRLPLRCADGAALWGDCVIAPLIEGDGAVGGYVAVVRDVTEERLRELQLRDAAQTDPLTGLCNRRGLEQHWDLLQSSAAHASSGAAWIMVDIDHFKNINDVHGHEGGDDVLKAVADTLQHAARGKDVVARLGGEEFVLLLPDVGVALATRIAERLRGRVQDLRVTTGGRTAQVTASFGVAIQRAAEGWTSALQRADAALYSAKRGGRNRVAVAAEAG